MSDQFKYLTWDLAGGSVTHNTIHSMEPYLKTNEREVMNSIREELFDNFNWESHEQRAFAEKMFKWGYLAGHTINHSKEIK